MNEPLEALNEVSEAFERKWLFLASTVQVLTCIREPEFPYEAEIRFMQLCAHAHLTAKDEPRAWANKIYGTRCLKTLRAKVVRKIKRREKVLEYEDKDAADREIAILSDVGYASLYNYVMQKDRSLARLVRTSGYEKFAARIRSSEKENVLAGEVFELLFRSIQDPDLLPTDRTARRAQIATCVSRTGQDSKSASAIRKAWQARSHRQILLYAAKNVGLDLQPVDLAQANIIPMLKSRVADPDQFRRFFGVCAYISDRLTQSGFAEHAMPFPNANMLPRVIISVAPYGDLERALLKDYDELTKTFDA